MKYLILIVLALIGIWWFRQQRQSTSSHDSTASQAGTSGNKQDMVPCAVCGVHTPQADAVRGQSAWYCSEAHRQQREG